MRRLVAWMFVPMLFAVVLYWLAQKGMPGMTRVVPRSYSQFLNDLEAGRLKNVFINEATDAAEGEFRDRQGRYRVQLPEQHENLLARLERAKKERKLEDFGTYRPSLTPASIANIIMMVVVGLFAFGLFMFWLRQMQYTSNQALSFGRSRARRYDKSQTRVTFNDVAGCDEAKEELREVIDFLKSPERFQALGAKIPRGVLLMGPPGSGKTLLARAVAGEADVPFFHVSGSEFVELFVGVGAARVRDLFEQAKAHKPCLVFIDELDAVGRLRFAGLGGGHDEREQTLNQLLVEMDGFDPNQGIILMSATNRPDVLDPALLRPGRFDRRIIVDNPDAKGRSEIFKVHLRGKPLAPDVDVDILARRTPGFSGADIANTVNEAALLAARRGKEKIEMNDLEDALEKVVAGPERKSRILSEREKKILAYHEAGHALVAKLIPNGSQVHKITIIPRGMALGYTMHLPQEDRYILTKSELLDEMCSLLGGRVAEELVFGEVTTGAQNDLERVTELARRMVCEFGMSENLGPVTLGRRHGPIFLGRDLVEDRNYSEEVASEIDKEVRALVQQCYERAQELLKSNRHVLDKIVEVLLEKESLDGAELDEIIASTKSQQESPAPQAVAASE